MRTREKLALERKRMWMNQRSDERLKWVRGKKDKDLNLGLGDADMGFPKLPGDKKPKELKWRKYLNTRRVYLKRTKRILVVEEIVKKKEVYTISGLNKSELSKVVEAIARS